MLTENDLPEGWELLASPTQYSKALDALLQGTSPDDVNNVLSWDEIRHTVTGTRILLRLAPPEVRQGHIVNEGAVITGVIVLPSKPNERVTAVDMRFPLGAIESAANRRRTSYMPTIKAVLTSAETGYEPPAPVGKPNGTDQFYGKVALLWLHFSEDSNPTERVREINNVPLSTAQRWVTEARKRNMLPPGRRGRAK